MTWHLLEKYVDVVSKRSTVIAKIWITCIYIFRVISVNRIAESLYADEQSAFKCNTRQPGCENMCFNEFSPISHSRFWGFQIIITFSPILMYFIYAADTVSELPIPKKLRKGNLRNRRRQIVDQQRRKERLCSRNQSQSNKESRNHYWIERGIESTTWSLDNSIMSVKSYGSSHGISTICQRPATLPLSEHYSTWMIPVEMPSAAHDSTQLPDIPTNSSADNGYRKVVNKVDKTEQTFEKVYRFVCLATILLETAFLVLQIRAFGFEVPEKYKCDVYPCPTTVDCFTSRPGEKSSVLMFMFFVTLLCIVLCLLEMISIPASRKRDVIVKNLCCLPTRNKHKTKGGGSCDGGSYDGNHSWLFVDRMLDASVDSESSGSSDTDETDKSVDSAELDEMYEQDGDFAEMETQDVDQGDDNECN